MKETNYITLSGKALFTEGIGKAGFAVDFIPDQRQ